MDAPTSSLRADLRWMPRPVWLLLFLLVIPLQVWRSRKESSVLEAKFGDEYRKYRASTWF